MNSSHIPVFLREALSYLELNDRHGAIADLTFGQGGHSFEFLKGLNNVELFSVDQDPTAIARGKRLWEENKATYSPNTLNLLHMNFGEFPNYWKEHLPNKKLDGILIDLGISSTQLDDPNRGLSFHSDAPLDMRMNQSDSSRPTAMHFINNLPEKELADLFYYYGEEKLSRKISRRIVQERQNQKIETCSQLAQIIRRCFNFKKRPKTDPATKCFQALRIKVNDELRILEEVLPSLYELLETGGRLMVISFHSLEDRIVKHSFKNLCLEAGANILTKRPLVPKNDEVDHNFRSRSAKLRVIEKPRKGTIKNGFSKRNKYKALVDSRS